MKWKTAISNRDNGEFHIRGHGLDSLMAHRTFTEVIYLLLRGQMPTPQETELMNAILVSCAEHGIEAPSAYAPRVSISVGNSLHAALAAGILAIGEWHGGAIEKAAEYIQSKKTPEEIIAEILKEGGRLPGYGHKLYKDADPRAEFLLRKAEELGLAGHYVRRARSLGQELARQTDKILPMNIDGAIAALISEMGFDWRLGKAFFALGRMPGMIAHAHEEMMHEKPYRRINEEDVEYTGPPGVNT